MRRETRSVPIPDEDDEPAPDLPGTSLTRLPRAAVLAAADARLHAGLLGEYLPLLGVAARTGRRLTAAELSRFRELGQAAAESGASLRALVDLYLSATWRVWPSLPAVGPPDAPTAPNQADGRQDGPAAGRRRTGPRDRVAAETMDAVVAVASTRAAAAAVLRASDDAVAAVCEGYEAARTARARTEEALRRELVDDLLTGTSTEVGLVLERAAVFGLRLEAPHVVLVAAGGRRFVEGRGSTRALDAALRACCLTEPLVAVKDGLLVCVVPVETDVAAVGPPAGTSSAGATDPADLTDLADPPDPATSIEAGRAAGRGHDRDGGRLAGSGASPAATQRQPSRGRRPVEAPGGGYPGFTPLPRSAPALVPAAQRAVADVLAGSGDPTWRVGVSRARSGVTGVRIGFDEARTTVELAGRLSLVARVTHTDDLLIYTVLLRDREPLAELVETVLAPLRAARGGAGPLLDTLDAYFATGGVALAAARRLHLSVRALTYRLDRIHQLTRHDPTSPTDRYVLQTAVIGARLLDWHDPRP
jgi:hypothetical protein